MAKDSSPTIALSVYIRAKCHEKVVLCFAETGQFDSILKYAKRAGYQPNYVRVLRLILYKNPDGGLEFAKSLLNNPDIEALDINALSNCFIETNLSSQFTAFLLEALKNNLPEQGDLQTKFLEQNILSNPQIVEQILARNIFTHFDKPHIASLCEKAGLIQWALQFYSDIYDIKRVIVQTHLINSDWLVSYFGSLSVHDSLSCLKVLMDVNRRQNLQIVVQVAVKYHEQLGAPALIQLFETSKCFEGLFMFLSTIVNSSQDPEVHFKYIQAACKTNQLKEVERICKESNYYDPEKVKNLLKEYKLSDQIPLIIVCDRFNFVEDLVLHLHKHNLLKYIEIYVHKVNPSRLPEIVGALLDVDCQEDFIKNMMIGCPPEYSTVKLIEEVSRRNRIKLLRKLVESRINSGSIEPAVHSALAIVNIDSNTRPEVFLKENPYYDSLIVGKYCEDRNPTLSCLAYEKGGNDDELIRVCTANSLYKNLSRYVILKKSQELWAKVLNPANDYRRSLIEQASQSILTESYEAECISEMVKALVAANLPDKLIDLLEKIVLVDSPHRHVRNLQNLLLLTSIRSDPSRLLDYIQRLDNYDAPNIADMAINHKLYEEAFAIYKKFEVHSSAIAVLTNLIKSLDRAFEYAERYNIPEAWSILGRSQLTNNQPKEAIESFLKANDFSQYNEVIAASSLFPIHESMIKYLSLCRTTVRDSSVDSGYAYCLAFTGRYEHLQDFLNQPHNVNVNDTGIRLFDEEKYEGAKILFKYSNNFSKLAVTHVKLKEYQFAVEMARKANKTKMWRVVCIACLDAGEYRFAHICALSLVIHPEELENLVRSYEELGLVQELLLLIEASVNLERAHMGVFTELAILYAKYKPTKLKDHLDLYWTRINIPKVLKNCEKYNLWSELVFLYDKYEEYDNAIRTMIRHPATAFNEPQFRDIIQKVANHELYQESINFYYEYKPFMLNDLLIVLTPRIDHSKIINQLKSLNIIPACKGYLIYAQKSNMAVINEAINDVYVEEEAYDDLRLSVESFNNFDAVKFADKLEQQPSVEFRRIAIFIRKSSNRWSQTLEMAKKDGLYDDAIIYAAESKDTDMAQSLLDHFIEINRPDYVVSHLYFSYDILKPDQVLESCWLNNMSQYCMPYMIQYMKECTSRLDAVETRLKKDPDTVEEQSVIYPIGHTLMIGGSNTFSAPTGGINPQNFVGQPQPLHPSMNSFTRPRFNPFS
ncbi:hypothetical protein HZS_4443 [Henneguya salminicola]|nr:hypothetical protein HZS_4443 [Henneguya salminicola]